MYAKTIFYITDNCNNNSLLQTGTFSEMCGGGANGELISFLNKLTTSKNEEAVKLLKEKGYQIISNEKSSHITIVAKKCKLKDDTGIDFFGDNIVIFDNNKIEYSTVNWWVLKQAKMLYVGDKLDNTLDDNSDWVYYKKDGITYTFWHESAGDLIKAFPKGVTYYKLEVQKY